MTNSAQSGHQMEKFSPGSFLFWQSDIFSYSINNKRLVRLTNHYGIDTEPSWSPDSKKIIFTSDRSGSPQLYEINTQSKEKKAYQRR